LFIIIITAFIISGCSSSMAEAAAPRVMLNNRPINFEVDPFIMEDRVMVPMRAIFEALGAEVEWDPQISSVTARSGSDMVVLTIGSRTAFVFNSQSSGAEAVDLDAPPVIVQDRTMVPLRFVGESLNADVSWDGNQRIVYITK